MSNPIGTITLWSGTIATIPAGWQLCDGTNGTPDLRQRFVQGADAVLLPDVTGGNVLHQHTFQTDGHDHAAGATAADTVGGPATHWDGAVRSSNETDTGTTNNQSNIPPFYALAYIQRML